MLFADSAIVMHYFTLTFVFQPERGIPMKSLSLILAFAAVLVASVAVACPPVAVGAGFVSAPPTFNPIVPVVPQQQAVCTGGCGLPAQGLAQAEFAPQYATASAFAPAPIYQAPVYAAPVFAQQRFATYAVAAPAFAAAPVFAAQPVFATHTVAARGGRHVRVAQRRAARAARRSVVAVSSVGVVAAPAVSVGVGVY